MKKLSLFFSLIMLVFSSAIAQDPIEILRESEAKLRGESAYSELKMTIIRSDWTREVTLKNWSMGTENALILITGPARDKGTAFLKRDREMWNWQPSIDRSIKMPPSMMMQSWMGSDFKNDDLVKESSMINDYSHKLLGVDAIDGRDCWKIELTPKEDAAVVWGKILIWIDKSEYMQLKTEFYDEDDYLVNTMAGKNIKEMDGKLLPSILEITPADEPENKTVLEYLKLDFGIDVNEGFFSVQNMKRVR